MNQDNLTTIQKEILYAIKQFNNKNGYSPSTRELCYLVNLSSTSSVHNQLNNLEKLGYIKRNKNKSRTIEVLENNKLIYLNNEVNILNNINNNNYSIDLNEKLKNNILIKDNKSCKIYLVEILNKYNEKDLVIYQDNDSLIIKNYDGINPIGKIIYEIEKK